MLQPVNNWQQGWKFFSAWALALLVVLASLPLSPELMAMLPPNSRNIAMQVVAVAGLILRFVQQKSVSTDTQTLR